MPFMEASRLNLRALRWASPSRRYALVGDLQVALDRWSKDWGLPVHVATLVPSDAPSRSWKTWPSSEDRSGPELEAWWSAAESSGTDDLAMGLGRLLWGNVDSGGVVVPVQPQALWLKTGGDAWLSLRERIDECLPQWAQEKTRDQSPRSQPPLSTRPWTSRCDLRLKLESRPGIPVGLVDGSPCGSLELDLSLLLSPPQKPRRPGPIPVGPHPQALSLAGALARQPMTWSAHLLGVHLDLGSWLSLVPGDVVRTSHPLSAPLKIWVQPCDSVGTSVSTAPATLSAQLVQLDHFLAISLLPDSAVQASDPHPEPDSGASRTAFLPSSQPLSAMPSSADPIDRPATDLLRLLDIPPAGTVEAPSTDLRPSLKPLLRVPVNLEVRVGRAQVTVQDLTEAKVGQVIRLDCPVDGLVDLLLDGQVVGRGRLVAVDEDFGVQMVELPPPLRPNPSPAV